MQKNITLTTIYYLHLKIKVYYIVYALLGGNGGITHNKSVFRYLHFRDAGHILVSISYRNSQNEIVKILKNCTKHINFVIKKCDSHISTNIINIKNKPTRGGV